MKMTDKIIGIAGAVLLVFCLVYYSIMNLWDVYSWISLVLGLAGSGYFLYVFYTKRERDFSVRNLQIGSNVIFQIIFVVAIVGLLAFLTTRRHYRIDWTENKLYSLADQSETLLEGLEKEVKIYAFYKETEQRIAADLLDEFAFKSASLEYEFIDPDEQPHLAKKYNITQYNQVVVECGFKREVIDQLNEANLTNSILKVTRDQDKTIYFLTGHGERSINEENQEGYKLAVDAIKNDNHLVKELNLVRRIGSGMGIPDTCTVLAIVSPKSSFFPGELDSIKTFIDNGGKVLFMLDPERPDDVAEFLKSYHVEVGTYMVLDVSGMGQLFGAGPTIPLVTEYDQSNPIMAEFSIMTFYPQATYVIPMEDKGGYEIKEILKSSSNSWAESELKNQVSFNEGQDIPGPVSMAALIEKEAGDKKISLAVFGDSDFAKNGYWKNEGNSNLFLNTINYLADEEDMITIRPKEVDDSRLTLTQAEVKIVFYLVVIAIPLLVIIAGVVIYVRRNR